VCLTKLVSVLSTPKIVMGAHGASARLVVSSVGLCIAASMAGCALHFVAPEDVGAGVCGPYLLSITAAGMLSCYLISQAKRSGPAGMALIVGVLGTASMTGCALYHLAPDDVGVAMSFALHTRWVGAASSIAATHVDGRLRSTEVAVIGTEHAQGKLARAAADTERRKTAAAAAAASEAEETRATQTTADASANAHARGVAETRAAEKWAVTGKEAARKHAIEEAALAQKAAAADAEVAAAAVAAVSMTAKSADAAAAVAAASVEASSEKAGAASTVAAAGMIADDNVNNPSLKITSLQVEAEIKSKKMGPAGVAAVKAQLEVELEAVRLTLEVCHMCEK